MRGSCPVRLFLEVAEAEVQGTKAGFALVVSNRPSCLRLERVDGRKGLGRNVLAHGGVQLGAPVIQAFFDEEGLCGLVGAADGPLVKVEGRRVIWTIRRALAVLRWLHGGHMPKGVALLNSRLAWDSLWSEHHEAVVRGSQVTIPGQSRLDSSDLAQEAGKVDLVEHVLQVPGQKASSFIGAVTSKPVSGSVDSDHAAVCGSEPQL